MIKSFLFAALLCLQFSAFSLMRSNVSDDTCTATVLLYSEIIKCVFSLVAVWLCEGKLFQNIFPILPPALCFLVMNLISFWAVVRVPASVYVIMMQLTTQALCVHKVFALAFHLACQHGISIGNTLEGVNTHILPYSLSIYSCVYTVGYDRLRSQGDHCHIVITV